MTEKLLQNDGETSVLTPDNVQARIEEEYSFYCNTIKPFVNAVEVYYGAVPDGLLNEVRNFVGHIAVATINYNDPIELRLKNVDASHTHLRRVLLDCYKLMCIYKQDYIKAFNRKFKYFNISDVDDGNFCVKLKKFSDAADEAFKEAKSSDSPGKNQKEPAQIQKDGSDPTDKTFEKAMSSDSNDENAKKNDNADDVYEKYQEAFNAYCTAADYIDEHFEGVIRVATKHVIGKVIGVLGWVITFVLALLSLRR